MHKPYNIEFLKCEFWFLPHNPFCAHFSFFSISLLFLFLQFCIPRILSHVISVYLDFFALDRNVGATRGIQNEQGIVYPKPSMMIMSMENPQVLHTNVTLVRQSQSCLYKIALRLFCCCILLLWRTEEKIQTKQSQHYQIMTHNTTSESYGFLTRILNLLEDTWVNTPTKIHGKSSGNIFNCLRI